MRLVRFDDCAALEIVGLRPLRGSHVGVVQLFVAQHGYCQAHHELLIQLKTRLLKA